MFREHTYSSTGDNILVFKAPSQFVSTSRILKGQIHVLNRQLYTKSHRLKRQTALKAILFKLKLMSQLNYFASWSHMAKSVVLLLP